MVSMDKIDVTIVPVTAMVDGAEVVIGEAVVPFTDGIGGPQIGTAELSVNEAGDLVATVTLDSAEAMNFDAITNRGLENAISISSENREDIKGKPVVLETVELAAFTNEPVRQNTKDKKEKN